MNRGVFMKKEYPVRKKYNRARKQKELVEKKEIIQEKAYVAIHDENKDGYIVLKQESLYKPLLVVFSIFIFVLVIIFPISIFDEMAPGAMDFMRTLVNWSFLSAVATLLPLPVSFSDLNLLRVVGNPTAYSNLYVALMTVFIVISDTFFAWLAYKFTRTLSKLFANKTKEKDEKKANERFQKYGNFAMFLGAATPLPFTLMIYTAGALKLPMKGFLLAVLIGRAVKYSFVTVPLRLFNFDLMLYGQSLLDSFLAGNLGVVHYIILGTLTMLIIWLSISIYKTVKKSKKEAIVG
jgi:membrane protein YqaA with SNARE-associated domain